MELMWRKASKAAESAACVEQAYLPWRKANKSGSYDCVEQVDLPERLSAIRDSKDKDGPMLVTSRDVFNSLLTDIKAGRLDL